MEFILGFGVFFSVILSVDLSLLIIFFCFVNIILVALIFGVFVMFILMEIF